MNKAQFLQTHDSAGILSSVLNLAGMGLWEWELDSGRLYGDAQLQRMLALSPEHWESMSLSRWEAWVHPDDQARFCRAMQAARSSGVLEVEYRLRFGDGQWHWVRDRSAMTVPGPDGQPAACVGVLEDLSYKQSEQRQHWQKLAQSVPGVIFSFTVDRQGNFAFPYISDRVESFYGLRAEEVERDASLIFKAIHPDDLAMVKSTIEDVVARQADWRCEYRALSQGEWRWVEGRSSPELQLDGSVVWHGLIFPIDERKRLEEQLRHLSLTDELTGLYNRRHLMSCMDHEVASFQRHRTPFSIVMLDLDHFKQVNDAHGHAVGDKVLQAFARLLRERVRSTDIVGRTGGEEFLVLLPSTVEAGALAFANSLREAIRSSVFSRRQPELPTDLNLSLSAGVASMKRVHESSHELWLRADKALYQAKHAGRDQVICA